MKNLNVKTLVLMALCIALSYVGSFVKISGTIAFDSLPGFFAAIALGPIYGGIVGLVGHLFTAFTSGFPFTLPIHLVIAIMMFASCSLFGFAYKKVNSVIGILVGIIMNGPVSLGISAIAMNVAFGTGVGVAMLTGKVPFLIFGGLALGIILTIAAAINIILASVLYEKLKKSINFK